MKLKTKIYSLAGEVEKVKEIPQEIFGVSENKILISEAIKVYLANQRRSKAKAKRRGDVSGSGRKIWRQKGTGRARHGDRYAPIFVGGGVSHGPTGKENWHLNFSKKESRKALLVALSEKFEKEELVFVNDVDKLQSKTKQAEKGLLEVLGKAVGLKKVKKMPKTSLILLKSSLAFRNLPWLKTTLVENLNTYGVLDNRYLVFEEKALEKFEEIFSKKSEK